MTDGIERSELVRWAACGAVVVFAHAAAATLIAHWSDPVAASESSGAIVVDLAPIFTSPSQQQTDIPPGPPMTESHTLPDPAPDQTFKEAPSETPVPGRAAAVEAKVEPRPVDEPPIEPAPPVANPEVTAAPAKEMRPPQRPKPKSSSRMAPATTAPQRAPQRAAMAAAPAQGRMSASAHAMQSWQGRIVATIQRHMRYPAEGRGEQGVPWVNFVIDRHGRLLSSRVARSSGAGVLDREALAILRHAQPLPPPPAEIVGSRFDFTVPVRFTVR